MIKTIPVLLFIGLLGAAINMDLQFEKHHKHSRSHEALMENGLDHQLWDYMRLRDPATGEIPRGIHIRELEFAKSIGSYRPALKGTPTIHTTGWNSAGPINTGGRTRAIGIDIANESNILIATALGGIYRSTDIGQSWTRTTPSGEVRSMSSLVQDHRNGKTAIWYAGTGEMLSTSWRRTMVYSEPNYHSADIGNGIYKSSDNGMTWNALPSTVDASPITLDSAFDCVWNIVVDNSRTDSDIVYAAGFGSIMRSNNGGSTWSRVLGDRVNTSLASDVQITSKGILYAYLSEEAAGEGSPSTFGFWRSTDGLNWTNITSISWPSGVGRMRIAIAPSDENTLYAGGVIAGVNPTLEFFKYTYVSGDGTGNGGVWEDRSSNVPAATGAFGIVGINTYGGYAIALRVLPTDANTVFFGGTSLFRSTDGFRSPDAIDWVGGYYGPYANGQYDSSQSYPNHHPDNHDIAFSPSDPNTLYSANDGGIFVSHDCLDQNSFDRPIEWTDLNFQDQASIVYVVSMDHATKGDTSILGGFQDQGSWLRYDSNYWGQWNGGDGCYCAVSDHKTAYYMSSQNGNVSRWTIADDTSYQGYATITPSGLGDVQFVTPWMLDPTNSAQMYFAADNTLWRNDDLAGIPDFNDTVPNWVELTNSTLFSKSYITALGMSVIPVHRLYYGSSDGHLYRLDNSDQGSPKPKDITGSVFPKDAFVSCVAVDPQNADSIVVCFSNYRVVSIFAWSDGGKTWHNASGNLEQNADGSGDGPSVRWVTIVHQNGETLYLCGTSVGLFSTTDISNNVTWNPEGLQTIGRAIVENIDARQSDGFVAIATQGSGVFSTHVVAAPSAVTSTFAASIGLTISPNPASQRATVSFALAAPAIVRLSVIDMTGKTVLRSLDGIAWPSGPGTVTLDCSRLPTGSYFVELQTDEAIETKRLVIER